MKAITSFLSIVAAISGTAFADDPHLRSNLDIQRSRVKAEQSREVAAMRESGQSSQETSIAVYAGDRGVGTTERTTSSRRKLERRPTILHMGRGERIVIPPVER